ncbi:hypothetical protein BLNAU_22391 [Blattamonas nauphoetae]|uniref:Uncharacterized protein n=1 Tax=Blattamonas nauphoetae TaxID=2049346 RepID=A0ABQ9WT65_9EUKA|nr:hypothetical protein BLNAU_22391 [Blattamonas nauphoetae]
MSLGLPRLRHPIPIRNGGITYSPNIVAFGTIATSRAWGFDLFVAVSSGKFESDFLEVIIPVIADLSIMTKRVNQMLCITFVLRPSKIRKISSQITLRSHLQSISIQFSANIVTFSSYQQHNSTLRFNIQPQSQSRQLSSKEIKYLTPVTKSNHTIRLVYQTSLDSNSEINKESTHRTKRTKVKQDNVSNTDLKRWFLPQQSSFLVIRECPPNSTPNLRKKTNKSRNKSNSEQQNNSIHSLREPEAKLTDSSFNQTTNTFQDGSTIDSEDESFINALQDVSTTPHAVPPSMQASDLESMVSFSSNSQLKGDGRAAPILITLESIQNGECLILENGRIVKSMSRLNSSISHASSMRWSVSSHSQEGEKLLQEHPSLSKYVERKDSKANTTRKTESESEELDWSDIDDAEDVDETDSFGEFMADNDTKDSTLANTHTTHSPIQSPAVHSLSGGGPSMEYSAHFPSVAKLKKSPSHGRTNTATSITLSLATSANLVMGLRRWMEGAKTKVATEKDHEAKEIKLEKVDEDDEDSFFSDEDIDIAAVRAGKFSKAQTQPLSLPQTGIQFALNPRGSMKGKTQPITANRDSPKADDLDFEESDDDNFFLDRAEAENQPVFDAVANRWVARGRVPQAEDDDADDAWLFEDDDDVFVPDRYTGTTDFELGAETEEKMKKRRIDWEEFGGKFGIDETDIQKYIEASFEVLVSDNRRQLDVRKALSDNEF